MIARSSIGVSNMALPNVVNIRNIGFVSTRISGTDGVSLEISKWSRVIERLGYQCYYIAGKCDRAPEHSLVIEEADFRHPMIRAINQQVFGRRQRTRDVSEQIHRVAGEIKDKLYSAIERFELDLLIAENALTIPINIPLGLALVEVILEAGIHCIAHHHDFVWERERFLVNAVDDYLRAAFPPVLSDIDHVVINSVAAEEFSRRTGLSSRIVPNVMDFARPPSSPDEYASDFRQTIGVAEDDVLILQPTRVVRRKGIEHAIELVHRLKSPSCKLVITHTAKDEGDTYPDRVREYAALLGVPVIFASPWISHQRGVTEEGTKQYAIWDVYPHADLVAYPSTYEGFGNAFLEAVYYKKPILCNRYTAFRTDIEPCGFRATVMDGFLTDQVVEDVSSVLRDEVHRREMVEHNYKLGQRFFSFDVVQRELQMLLARPRPERAA